MTKKALLLIGIIFVGLALRIYLVFSLPLWLDEHITLRIIDNSFPAIFSGVVDAMHPPGYYILLKLMSLVSQNPYWYRSSTLLFYVINSLLLFVIGNKLKDSKMGLVLTTLYTFSGYFIVFDWQFRMYTGLMTLILVSYLLINSANSKVNLFYLVIVNTLGQFFDYGFFFYFLPLSAWLCIKAFIDDGKEKVMSKVFAFLISFLIFIIFWGKSFLSYFGAGLQGISWIENFIKPSFFVSFFLGSHSLPFFTVVFLLLLIIGIYVVFNNKKSYPWKVLVAVALCSLIFNMVISYLGTPILHVRSLQIVGNAILILYALGLDYLFKRSRVLGLMVIGLFIVNCLFIVYNFPKLAGWYLVAFTGTS